MGKEVSFSRGGETVFMLVHDEGMFAPVFLILVGALILLWNVGILPPGSWRFWPLILIIPGLIKISGFGDGLGKK